MIRATKGINDHNMLGVPSAPSCVEFTSVTTDATAVISPARSTRPVASGMTKVEGEVGRHSEDKRRDKRLRKCGMQTGIFLLTRDQVGEAMDDTTHSPLH